MLENINYPKDVKKLSIRELNSLANEIREFLISNISKTGGHLASNLGAVELTLAMLKVFNFPEDDVIWDVGHQSYVYKILTGRREELKALRELDCISGFPSRKESSYDSFGTGHASTSIAAAQGILTAKRLKNDFDSVTIAVIGDGSLTGGMALEGISNLSHQKGSIIIILNDNEMSIDENVGIAKYISNIRLSKQYLDFKDNISNKLEKGLIRGSLYKTIKKTKDSLKRLVLDTSAICERLGIKYYGPIDGHDIYKLCTTFNNIKKINQPILLHIKTIKGNGYKPAIENPSKFHGISPFHIETGKTKHATKKTFTDVFADSIYKLFEEKHDVVALTAAMLSAAGLKNVKKDFPDRVIDVGIAEEYAVTFAAGVATKNLRPVVCIYSTFLQRAYDQILHDVCLQNLPVIFAIDRAGIVGKDGATHQGVFDISYLSGLPNMNIIAPINEKELQEGLKYAYKINKPVAIRYPRGSAISDFNDDFIEYSDNNVFQKLVDGDEIAIIGVGTIIHECAVTQRKLNKANINAALINPRILKPLNTNRLKELLNQYKKIVVVEEGILSGGFASSIITFAKDFDIDILPIAINDEFVEHGEVSMVRKKYGLDADSIYNKIINRWYNIEKTT